MKNLIEEQMDFLTKSTKETFRPLTKDELATIDYNLGEGYIDDEQYKDFIKNPSMARDYIASCEAQQDLDAADLEEHNNQPNEYDK